MTPKTLLALLALAIPHLATAQAAPRPVPREQAFPIESLPENLRPKAEALLLQILDNEGLYTLLGVKPMTSGFASVRIDISGMRPEERQAALAQAEELRQILPALRIPGYIETALIPYASTAQGQRALEAFVFHRPAVAQTIARFPGLFGFYGITPSTPPAQIVLAFEPDPNPARFTAFGHLFGYPEHAVRFFTQAEISRRDTGEFVKRDFFQIPAFSSESGRYVYAVPAGHVPLPEDLALRERCLQILATYRRLRAQYIGEGKPGPVALLRDWMDDGTGQISPGHALAKSGL